MVYIPSHSKWYVADLVFSISIQDDPDTLVHINTMLVRADSPEEAYDNSLLLGRDSEDAYLNPDGKLVTVRFRGISDLNVIYDDLEHGAELFYEEKEGVSEEEIRALIPPKEKLNVFLPDEPEGEPPVE